MFGLGYGKIFLCAFLEICVISRMAISEVLVLAEVTLEVMK